MTRRAIVPFVVVGAALVTVLAADTCARRPTQIAAPPYADSLAGVIVRVAGYGDSTLAVTWWQSPEAVLAWIDAGDTYDYQGRPARDLTPLGARADLTTNRLTFAKGQLGVALSKHELVHLILHEPNHPPVLFRKIESYHGR